MVRPRSVVIGVVMPIVAIATWTACGDDSSFVASDGGVSSDGSVDATSTSRDGSSVADAGAINDGASDAGKTDAAADAAPPFDAGASVVQHHADAARTGFYVDPKLSRPAIAASFGLRATWPVSGPIFAAPLFVDGFIKGRDAIIVASEQNIVYALDANSMTAIWQTPVLATPIPLAKLIADVGCGVIDPLGITGTPYIDVQNRTMYLDAMTTPDDGTTKRHLVYALSIDDGSVKPGWPVDLEAKLSGAPVPFVSGPQNQRGALALVNGVLYVPFGGHAGDCSVYHGFIVGVDVNNPTKVLSWATPAQGGGAWGPAGVSSDGKYVYMTTGNTFFAGEDAGAWLGGEAVVRFTRGPVFSGAAADFFAPPDWPALDDADLDLGGSAGLLADVAGATPSALAIATGKNGTVYLMDRASLGGVGGQVASMHITDGIIRGSASVYRAGTGVTAGTYLSFRTDTAFPPAASCPNGTTGNLMTVKIVAGSPPTVAPAWCSERVDLNSPSASATTAAGTDTIVWSIGGQSIYGYDGATGAVVFDGGTQADAFLGTVHYFQTPIVAKGRVYVAGQEHVYAYGP